MLADLKFVKGSVSKKDIVPALTHFRIAGGRITGYNGKMAISSPIAIDIECCPKADTFIKAISACDSTVQLNMTPTGRLTVKSGKFRSFVECFQDEFPDVQPEGNVIEMNKDFELIPVFKTLYAVTSDDASRPWAAAIRLSGHYAYATNNVIAAQMWLPFELPFTVCIPRFAVEELMRIGTEPVKLHICDHAVTFEYENTRWLRTQLNSTDWPHVEELLDKLPTEAPAVPSGLFEAVEKIKPFVNKLDQVFFHPDRISTSEIETEGTSIEFENLPNGKYSATMLLLLDGLADSVDFAAYPKPAVFYGKRLRGAIVGMR